jgi:L-cysteine/cystine lyase
LGRVVWRYLRFRSCHWTRRTIADSILLCHSTRMSFKSERARAELPSVRHQAYLNAGTFGPSPQRVADAMRARIDDVLANGRTGKAGIMRWIELGERARAAFALSLGVSTETVALMHCTTDGVNTVLWGLTWQPGDEIITTTAEHPGLTAPLDAVVAQKGVRVHYVAPTRDAIRAALSARTKLVAVSHVLWTNGDTLPIAEIVHDTHAAGARVLVDGAQSAGAIALDLRTLGVDYYTVSGQKWLCGPSGTGALYIHPDSLAALSTPWPWYLSKNRFGPTTTEWTTARRLDASTLSITSLAGIVAAIEFHQEQVQAGGLAYALALAFETRAALQRRAGISLVAAESPSTLVSFTKEGTKAEDVTASLELAKVFVRSIPGVNYVRVSVGFWNNQDDIEQLVRAL